jgi:hypothetical protein
MRLDVQFSSREFVEGKHSLARLATDVEQRSCAVSFQRMFNEFPVEALTEDLD